MIALPKLPEPLLRVLLDCATPDDEISPEVGEFLYFGDGGLEGVWAEHRTALLRAWIEEFPGRRPEMWWRVDAPRQAKGRWPGRRWDGTLPEPRERLGGSGTPAWEAMAIAPAFPLGVPDLVDVDPADPSLFESQAAYLRRHGLLLPGEARRLRPRDFEPERIKLLRQESDADDV